MIEIMVCKVCRICECGCIYICTIDLLSFERFDVESLAVPCTSVL